jgi:hypothetical protein
MQLKELSLFVPMIEPGTILKALETAIPASAIEPEGVTSTPSGEVESTIDELKVHLLGRKTLIRSRNPREVVQEVYGWLLGHWAVRSLMFQVAEQADISPLRLSFTGTLNVVRRAVPKFQRLELTDIPLLGFAPWSGNPTGRTPLF